MLTFLPSGILLVCLKAEPGSIYELDESGALGLGDQGLGQTLTTFVSSAHHQRIWGSEGGRESWRSWHWRLSPELMF